MGLCKICINNKNCVRIPGIKRGWCPAVAINTDTHVWKLVNQVYTIEEIKK